MQPCAISKCRLPAISHVTSIFDINPINPNPSCRSDKKSKVWDFKNPAIPAGSAKPTCRGHHQGGVPDGESGVPGAPNFYFWQVMRLDSGNYPQETNNWTIARIAQRAYWDSFFFNM